MPFTRGSRSRPETAEAGSPPGVGFACGTCGGGARVGVAVPSLPGSDPPLSARCEKGFAAPQPSLSSTKGLGGAVICAEKAGEQLAVLLSPLMLRLTQINTEESFHCSKANAAEVVQAKPLRVFCLW